VAASQRLLSFF